MKRKKRNKSAGALLAYKRWDKASDEYKTNTVKMLNEARAKKRADRLSTEAGL